MKTINDYAELVKEKHALNKAIAPVETDLTDASRGYHIGEQFIYDGEIYKAKTEIAQHDALVLNTNYEPADDLTTQIKNAGGGTGTDPRLDVFENNIAPVETDETDASKAYQVGEQLILNNILYDVIAAISEHDIITTTGSGANIAPAGQISSKIQTLTNKLIDEAATRSTMGAKNLLPFDMDAIKALNTAGTWTGNVYSYRGVDFTVNSDGTILADGQATGGNASIKVFAATSSYEMLGKNVILNGCPSGGSATTYRIQAYRMGSVDGSAGTYFDDGAGTVAFDALNDASGTVGSFAIAVYENYDADNLLFKPMVRLATDSDDTYQPYAKTNKELADDVSSLNTAIANKADSSKAYQTDDTTETTLASDDVLPFYDTSATAKRKMTVQKFGEQLISNRNLLDNPWFTVNQRGQTTYGDKTTTTDIHEYTVDRWIVRVGQAEVVDNGIKVYPNLYIPGSSTQGLANQSGMFGQSVDNYETLLGKTITLSVDISELYLDETEFNTSQEYGLELQIASGNYSYASTSTYALKRGIKQLGKHSLTFTLPDSLQNNHTRLNVFVRFVGRIVPQVTSNSYYVVRSMKLEIGSISTLAMDTIPNYATELLKCQRFYYASSKYFTTGCITTSAKDYVMDITLPTAMRTAPSILLTGYQARLASGGYSNHTPNDSYAAPESLSLSQISASYQNIRIKDTISTAVDTNNILASFIINDLKLSADL